MAAAIFKKRLEEKKINNIEVYSCGIYAEDGQAAMYTAIAAMDKYDIDLKNHKTTDIRNSNIKDMDIILCTTKSHRDMVKQMYPDLCNKIYTIKEYVNYDGTGQDLNIPDPWGYDLETYLFCAKQMSDCINILIDMLKSM